MTICFEIGAAFSAAVAAAMLTPGAVLGANPQPVEIRGIRHQSSSDSTQVIVQLQAAVQYKFERLSDPDRLYVDLLDTKIGPQLTTRWITVDDTFLNRIRIGQTPVATRVVFDLNPGVGHTAVSLQENPPALKVILPRRTAPAVAAAASSAAPGDAGAPQAAPAASQFTSPALPIRPAPPPAPAKSSIPVLPAAQDRVPGDAGAPQAAPAASQFTSPALPIRPARPPAPAKSSTPVLPVAPDRVLRIPRVSRPPILEDFLTGRPREAEVQITDFRQREPGDGVPATEQTAAYLSYDDRNLYVVFVCKDDPRKVRARLVKREDIGDDDQVSVYLDTFRDHQRAYVFNTNPLGIQQDGVITEGEKTDYSFDTLWYSEGRLTADGFVVWMALPFKSLRFSGATLQTWGVALSRSIFRKSESSFWPYITQRIEGLVSQMGVLEGFERISPGHNIQLIPYATFTRSRFLDTGRPAFLNSDHGRGGLDSKVVFKDAMTLDVALNPDFSEVESNEPQVTVNQRFEVFFPEKRPFFIENAGFFQTPLNLFFSRRIADPQFGARLTGKVGRWVVGVLGANDRAPGRLLPANDPLSDRGADIGVMRIQREFGAQSNIGVMATSRDFGSSSNRVFSLDTRLKLAPNWVFSGQAVRSFTRNFDRSQLSGAGYFADLTHSGRHLSYDATYTDLSPTFRSQLGFIRRVDIREMDHAISYLWRPEGSHILAFGPSVSGSAILDRQGQTTDWSSNADFSIYFTGQTQLKVSRSVGYELFQHQGFHKNNTNVSFFTGSLNWLAFSAFYGEGTGVNYDPGSGRLPFLANTQDGTATLTVRPKPRIRFDQTYIYSRLGTRLGFAPAGISGLPSVFNNHLVRWKTNVQFTRALSLRTIIDYNALLPNKLLLAQEGYKQFTGDVLLTYLINPGTALYIGYNNRYENLVIDPTVPYGLRRTLSPTIPTGRQIFIKLSYLFRF